MKKRILALLLVGVLALLGLTGCGGTGGETTDPSGTSGNTDPENSLPTLPSTKTKLIVGFDADFPPMGFRDTDGKFTGFDLDLAEEVAKRLNVEIVKQDIIWDNKDNELEAGTIDMIWNGFTISEARKTEYEWTRPYMNNKQVVVVEKDSAYQTLADLAGKKVAIQGGSTAVDAVAANPAFKDSITLVEVKDNLKALMELQTGATEAVAMDLIVADYTMTKNPDKYRILDEVLLTEVYGVGFLKGNTDLRDVVQACLDAMYTDGTFKTISEKWFGHDVLIPQQ